MASRKAAGVITGMSERKGFSFSLRSRRLEVRGGHKKIRAREKETPLACPFSLAPTTSKCLLRRLGLGFFVSVYIIDSAPEERTCIPSDGYCAVSVDLQQQDCP